VVARLLLFPPVDLGQGMIRLGVRTTTMSQPVKHRWRTIQRFPKETIEIDGDR
jgi:hypothetical protein